jgi:hypothetical protein
MAIPTKEKTWQAVVVRQLPTGSNHETCRRLIYALKLAFLTAGWTVARSCNGSSFADSDLWDAWSKVTWNVASSARSWIVLRAPVALHPTLYLLIETAASEGTHAESPRGIYCSYSLGVAYTGGSTTARPTAAGEVVLRTGQRDNVAGRWLYNSGAPDLISTFNLAYASDGTAIRCQFCNAAASPTYYSFFDLQRAVDLVGGGVWDADPVSGLWVHQPLYANLNDAASATAKLAGTAVTAVCATLGWITSMAGENQLIANEIGGLGWPMTEILLWAQTVGKRGPYGRLRDLFFGSTAISNGTTYPASGDREWVQFGHLVMAWNGLPGVPGTIPDIC